MPAALVSQRHQVFLQLVQQLTHLLIPLPNELDRLLGIFEAFEDDGDLVKDTLEEKCLLLYLGVLLALLLLGDNLVFRLQKQLLEIADRCHVAVKFLIDHAQMLAKLLNDGVSRAPLFHIGVFGKDQLHEI